MGLSMGATSGNPTGAVTMFVSTTPPSGYLICNGNAVSRTTYAALFAVIGTSYGAGDGSTTFNLPNFCARMPVGIWNSDPDFATIGNTGGEKFHTLTVNEMPSHNHNEIIHGQGGSGSGYGVANYYGSLGGSAASVDNTANTGGGASHNNMPPYTVINFIIKT